jgi:Holliday junction resolvasome RuvABC endonuclease subunit
MILCLDLSLSCTGYSVFGDDGSFVKTGHIETDGKTSTPLRLNIIAKVLRKLNREYKPRVVLIEKGFTRFIRSTEQLYRVHGVANLVFYNTNQIEIHATSVRKTLTGSGNMKKKDFRAFIEKSYPDVEFSNDDEVDSFGLGLAYIATRLGETNNG